MQKDDVASAGDSSLNAVSYLSVLLYHLLTI